MPNNNPEGKGGFEKGKSGNPNGRPKSKDSFSAVFEEYIKKEKSKEASQWLIEKMVESIDGKNTTHLVQAFERYFGKVTDIIKHEGSEDSPIKYIIEVRKLDEGSKT